MNIRQATESDFESVKKITQETIHEVYPKYYPAGAVKFFSEHHADEKIIRDITAGIVYVVVTDDGVPAGTVTLTENEVDRLFVLPEFQGKGYGKDSRLLRCHYPSRIPPGEKHLPQAWFSRGGLH